MVIVGGKKYYSLEEAATLADVSVRTLRRWLSGGRLSDFLFPFRAGPTEVLYRLEPPEEDEQKNEKGEWVLKKGGEPHEGVGVT